MNSSLLNPRALLAVSTGAIITTTSLLITFGLAGPSAATVTASRVQNVLLLKSDTRIRFQADHNARLLTVPDAQLAQDSKGALDGIEVTSSANGFSLSLPYAFTARLAGDARTITVQQDLTGSSPAPSSNAAANATGSTTEPPLNIDTSLAPPTTPTPGSEGSSAAPSSGTGTTTGPSSGPTGSTTTGPTGTETTPSGPAAARAGAPSGSLDERLPLVIPLSNASPAYVAGLLARAYNVRVEVDERQRAVIIFVSKTDWPLIKTFVADLDKARPQVSFEAEVLEINQYATQSLGIDYRELFSLNFTEGAPPSLFKLGDVTRGVFNVKLGLDALKNTGAATVLSRPSITTLDGLEARLNATQTTPVVTAGTNGVVQVNNVTTGITLRFVPKVGPDGMIESNLSIAVSSPTGTTTQGVPQYSSREANTTVRVRDGEPIIIGGLYENRRTTSSKGLPGLMDIPILGELFKTTVTDEHFTDLVIVVTPRLVGGMTAAGIAPRAQLSDAASDRKVGDSSLGRDPSWLTGWTLSDVVPGLRRREVLATGLN
jgi:general secretion pathway protein D